MQANGTAGDAERTVAVVLNWRSAHDTIRCVTSLLEIDRPLDIVVVDNDSGDGSPALIKQELAEPAARAGIMLSEAVPAMAAPWREDGGRTLLLVGSGRNGGYAFGNNVGITLALQQHTTAFVWVLNADTLIPGATTLDALVARMAEDSSIGLCGATVAYMGHDGQVQTRAGGRFQASRARAMPLGAGERPDAPVDRAAIERELAYVNGAATFARRAFLETVGLMREDYFLYYEEFDWARRAAGLWRLGYAPEALVLHQVGGAIGTDDFGGGSPLSTFYLTRNRLRFLAKYHPLVLPIAVADELKHLVLDWSRARHAQVDARLRALAGRAFSRQLT